MDSVADRRRNGLWVDEENGLSGSLTDLVTSSEPDPGPYQLILMQPAPIHGGRDDSAILFNTKRPEVRLPKQYSPRVEESYQAESRLHPGRSTWSSVFRAEHQAMPTRQRYRALSLPTPQYTSPREPMPEIRINLPVHLPSNAGLNPLALGFVPQQLAPTPTPLQNSSTIGFQQTPGQDGGYQDDTVPDSMAGSLELAVANRDADDDDDDAGSNATNPWQSVDIVERVQEDDEASLFTNPWPEEWDDEDDEKLARRDAEEAARMTAPAPLANMPLALP